MECRNSYFQLIIGEKDLSMKYYPPTGGGEVLTIDEIIMYLDEQGVKDYDIKVINDAIATAKEPTIIKISNEPILSAFGVMKVKVTPDKMYAIARFYPPNEGREGMAVEEIERDLSALRITNGILTDAIKQFVRKPEYCKNIVVAMGKKPVQGRKASIEYMFKTDKKAKPRLKEDGSVDFHQLDNISHVRKGDVLAVLTKEYLGESGKDIYGNEVRPARVDRLTLKYGKNIEITEDGLKLISQVDGHVSLEGDRVFVSDNFDVPADVDNSTGDIEYNGSVTVRGNVRTGFAIKAKGNIEILGVVEGANIYAEGDIILHRGIQGMSKGHLECKGNLISKFIESAEIKVDGYIETDTILHSNVSAKGDIYVRGKNGNIIGGKVRSTSLIEATRIGSTMGTLTEVEVGTDPTVSERIREIQDSINEKTEEKNKLDRLVGVLRKKQNAGTLESDKLTVLQNSTRNMIICDSEIKKLTEEYEKLTELIEANKNAIIKAKNDVFSGTKVVIAGDFILIHDDLTHVRFKKERGEIKSAPY